MTDVSHFPRKRPAQKRAQRTVEEILDATAQILDEGDFDTLNTNRVAERAGYSIGTLYHYFPDKQSLVRALAFREIKRSEVLFDQVVEAHRAEGPEAIVRAITRVILAPFAGRPNIRRAIIAHTITVTGLDPMIQAEMEEMIDRLTDRLLDCIAIDRSVMRAERRFLLLRSLLGPVRLAALRAPHLLASLAFEDELVATASALLRPEPAAAAECRAG